MHNINLYAKYNDLKKSYFEKLVADIQLKDMRQFSKIMQHKRKVKSALPITMVYNDQHLFGQARHHFIYTCKTVSPYLHHVFQRIVLHLVRNYRIFIEIIFATTTFNSGIHMSTGFPSLM